VVVATIACAVAGYVVGHTKDRESTPALASEPPNADAEASDNPSDASEGSPAAQKGFDKGFSQAQEDEFAKAFARAYREAYVNVFEASGLEPPKEVTVPSP
jgi:flagellar biosynthesis/type III secretory pathway protein FliH